MGQAFNGLQMLFCSIMSITKQSRCYLYFTDKKTKTQETCLLFPARQQLYVIHTGTHTHTYIHDTNIEKKEYVYKPGIRDTF